MSSYNSQLHLVQLTSKNQGRLQIRIIIIIIMYMDWLNFIKYSETSKTLTFAIPCAKWRLHVYGSQSTPTTYPKIRDKYITVRLG